MSKAMGTSSIKWSPTRKKKRLQDFEIIVPFLWVSVLALGQVAQVDAKLNLVAGPMRTL